MIGLANQKSFALSNLSLMQFLFKANITNFFNEIKKSSLPDQEWFQRGHCFSVSRLAEARSDEYFLGVGPFYCPQQPLKITKHETNNTKYHATQNRVCKP